jgi:enoyl-CoA hydratase
MSNPIKIEHQYGSVIVTFNRPKIRNPLSIAVVDELTELISRLESNVSSLIITGTEDVFASGADLREIARGVGNNAVEFAERGQKLMVLIANLSAITIAAVNGFCYGGALDLALACKVRIASPKAEFCHPGANLGIMTGWGGTQRLPRLVGEAKALEMFLISKRIDSREAFTIGLIDQIAEDVLTAAINYFPSPRPI